MAYASPPEKMGAFLAKIVSIALAVTTLLCCAVAPSTLAISSSMPQNGTIRRIPAVGGLGLSLSMIFVSLPGSFQTKFGLPGVTFWNETPAAVGGTPPTGVELTTLKLPATL